jgi:hypothetical protein
MRTEKSSEDMLIEGSRKKKPLTSIGEGKEEDKHSSQGDEDAEESQVSMHSRQKEVA